MIKDNYSITAADMKFCSSNMRFNLIKVCSDIVKKIQKIGRTSSANYMSGCEFYDAVNSFVTKTDVCGNRPTTH